MNNINLEMNFILGWKARVQARSSSGGGGKPRLENKEALKKKKKKCIHLYKDIKKKMYAESKMCAAKLNAKTDMKWAFVHNAQGKKKSKIRRKKTDIFIIIFIFTTKPCLNYPSQGMWRWLQFFAHIDWQWYDFFGTTFVVSCLSFVATT